MPFPHQELESEGRHRQAEHHFVEASDWKAAVNMYRGKDLWDDAYRVWRNGGGGTGRSWGGGGGRMGGGEGGGGSSSLDNN